MVVVKHILNPFAKIIHKRLTQRINDPIYYQNKIWKSNISRARETDFGKDHGFKDISCYSDFKRNVPITDYEGIRHYMDRVKKGERNVLWPGRPQFIVGTAGTTSGIKYIPLSKESIPYHFGTARNAVFNYAYKYGLMSLFEGKLLFLSGSPKLDVINGIPTGRLSGIVNHQIPAWLRLNQVPSYQTNIIEDWEQKIEAIVQETRNVDLRMISGIPPWMIMYMERLLHHTREETILDVFRNLSLLVYGGLNFEPYRQRFERLLGREIHTLETYPATEGFIGFKDEADTSDLVLNVDAGVFYEFVPASQLDDPDAYRIPLEDVKVGEHYAIVMSNNAGLFASMIGDIVSFTSIRPYRLVIKGRTKHFISAFGEHVIGEEVEKAMSRTIAKTGEEVSEFTLAPCINPIDGGLPYHEWVLEMDASVMNYERLSKVLDEEMKSVNFHYQELRDGKVIRPLQIRVVEKGSFIEYQKSIGKLGGQNKIARLSNDRMMVEELLGRVEVK